MLTAKLFKNGRSQAVRLPKDFRFKGRKVGIVKIGEAVLLFPPDKAWEMMQHAIDNFTPDFMASRDQPTNVDKRQTMTRYMLDTNICVEVIRRRSAAVMERFLQTRPGDIGLSVITLCELEFGAAKSADPLRNRSLLLNFCAPLQIFSFEDIDAEAYGPLHAGLERAGTSIGPLDSLIAAHALALKLILITNNEREFRRVPGLRVENWTRP